MVNGAAGAAYVFEALGASYAQAKLVAPNSSKETQFGNAVAVDGHFVVVGAHQKNLNPSVGAVYVFKRQGAALGYDHLTTLTPTDMVPVVTFGMAVAIAGNRIAVGAPGQPTNAASGVVYTFQQQGKANFKQTAKLTASDGKNGAYFGHSVGISAGRLVVGSWGWTSVSGGKYKSQSGAAYLYEVQANETYKQLAKLENDPPGSAEAFGTCVALDRGRVVVGAHTAAGKMGSTGAAWVYQMSCKNDWHCHDSDSCTTDTCDTKAGTCSHVVKNPCP